MKSDKNLLVRSYGEIFNPRRHGELVNHTRGEEGLEGSDFYHGNNFEEVFDDRNNDADICLRKKGIAIFSSWEARDLN
jgi:hypothetical protein